MLWQPFQVGGCSDSYVSSCATTLDYTESLFHQFGVLNSSYNIQPQTSWKIGIIRWASRVNRALLIVGLKGVDQVVGQLPSKFSVVSLGYSFFSQLLSLDSALILQNNRCLRSWNRLATRRSFRYVPWEKLDPSGILPRLPGGSFRNILHHIYEEIWNMHNQTDQPNYIQCSRCGTRSEEFSFW